MLNIKGKSVEHFSHLSFVLFVFNKFPLEINVVFLEISVTQVAELIFTS